RKMTWDPCRVLNIQDRGLIKEGYKADLVVFDPDQIKDTATYASPFSHPQGIHYVIVNGQLAVSQGETTGIRAGRVVKSKR
ncbi:MAG: amidohydrolase family protein, partial [Thermodesulfobacteriota bacterium]